MRGEWRSGAGGEEVDVPVVGSERRAKAAAGVLWR